MEKSRHLGEDPAAGKGFGSVDTRPISAVLAIASYQLPVARDFSASTDLPRFSPTYPEDSVQISPEARKRAAEAADKLHLWGEVRYDPPHNDDPDLPWEAAHQEWMDLMTEVFGAGQKASAADSGQSEASTRAS
mgnify:CR=1 FL=1